MDIIKPIYGNIWASAGEKLSPDAAKIASGWVQEMMPYQYENFLQNRTDVALSYLFQKGIPEWSTDQEYIANKSIVTYMGQMYMSLTDSTNIAPTNISSWKKLTIPLGINGAVPVASGGTGATDATTARTNLGLGTASTLSADSIVLKSVTGNAPAADKWTAPITITLSGAASGSVNFDGSANATLSVTSLNASSLSSGTVPSSALENAVLKTSPTGSLILPAGTTSQRDLSPSAGYTRWNTTNLTKETFNGTVWTVDTAQSEAFLLNRANQTGTQDISTTTTGTLPINRGGTGQTTASAAFDAIKQPSTETYAGVAQFATKAENISGVVEGKAVDPLGVREAFNVVGPAPMFACRAWVNFDGTGTPTIRSSGNVSSIGDFGVGEYRVNFITGMNNSSYSVTCSCSNYSVPDRVATVEVTAVTSAYTGIKTGISGSTIQAGFAFDPTTVTLSVIA